MHEPDPEPPWLTRQRLEVGARVRDARLWANLNQPEMGEKLGIDRQSVYRFELGITDPPVSRLLHIAKILGIPPSDLLPDEPAGE